MAIRKLGSRKIVVDGESFLWKIRQKSKDDCEERIGVGIQHADEAGATLIVSIRRFRPSDCVKTNPVLPKEVADIIRKAISKGWKPRKVGPQFVLDMEESES